MKKTLLLGAVVSMVSTSAIASQARLLALGMKEIDNEGMYHISDARNIFLNPAYANIYNDYVTVEFGRNGFNPVGVGSATLNTDSQPKAEGGFFKKHGDMVYGLYLGNESNTSSLLRFAGTAGEALTTGSTLNSADNQFDLFLAGDNGLKWGANVTFANGKDEARKAKDTSIATRWGLIGSNWDAHLNVSLASKAEAVDATIAPAPVGTVYHEFKGKLGLQLGGSYVLSGNNRAFGYVKHYGWDQSKKLSAATATTTWKGDFTSYYLGWGTHYNVSETGKVFVSFSGKKTDINAKFANKGEVRSLVLPLSVAFESQANGWLTLRGSITQNIWSKKDNKNLNELNQVAKSLIINEFGSEGKGTVANSTDVRAGATLTFGKLDLDALIGISAGNTKNGELNGNNLFSRAALTYSF